ncbi:MAG: dethiobiotin synthase [Balneolales bacterium]
MDFPGRIFITGTDTSVGKTVVSAILTAGLQAAYWKPVQSGLEEDTDTTLVQRHTGLPGSHFFPEAYRLTRPLSPHLSSRMDGVHIRLDGIMLPDYKQKHLVIEGAGGVMVPLNDKHLMIDLIRNLESSVILVTRSGLGTINHTLLTLEKLQRMSIPVFGVVMNGKKNPGNKQAIEKYGNATVIAEIEPFDHQSPAQNKHLFGQLFNT